MNWLTLLIPDPRGFWLSLVRTYAPLVVGLIATGVAKFGIRVDNATTLTLTTALGAAVWYALARTLELHWPSVGRWLLGTSAAPSYQKND